MRKIIGYLGGTRIDYQGYPSKGGILPENFNDAVVAMRKAKERSSRHFNTRWRDNDYIQVFEGKTLSKTIKMKDVWARY